MTKKRQASENTGREGFVENRRKDLDKWTVMDIILAALAIGIVMAIAVFAIGSYVPGWEEWTGITKPKQHTFWDWLDLLIVPIVLALGGYLFNRAENRRTEKQTEEDREIALGHSQDEALQNYLDKISQLLTDKTPPLDKAEQNDPRRTVARAWTLTVLDTLDSSRIKGLEALESGRRKRRVVKFLYEANLICSNRAIVSLSKVNLIGADLSEADLRGAGLRGADLRGADLRGADLSRADLSGVDLSRADLSGVDLTNARVTKEQLREAEYLKGTTMRDGKPIKSDDNPDGPTFAAWFKSKEDGENGSQS
jgi:Pentapeptide repeats (8 copies)